MEPKRNFFSTLENIVLKYSLPENVKENFKFIPFSEYGSYKKTKQFVIFEDWWIRKPEVVISKMYSICGISTKIYGRECKIKKITKPLANLFLSENHILASVNSKIKYGLFHKDELVSVATFAAQRQFRDGSRSAELLRFCHKNRITVTGGTDKLLQAYIRDHEPDEIMTYIDLDWGTGDAFRKLGFQEKELKKPHVFFVHINSGERIPEKYFADHENINDYKTVKNSGSLKMVKRV